MLRLAASAIGNGQLDAVQASLMFGNPYFDIGKTSMEKLENQSQPLFDQICGT